MVRIVAARLIPYALPFAAPWTTSRAVRRLRRGWLVELQDGTRTGYGDCAPLPEAGTETDEEAHRWLQPALTRLVHEAASELPLSAPPAARFAVETALLDLEAQRRGVPLWQLLTDEEPPEAIACNAVGGPLGENTGTLLREAADDGYRVVKLKVGLARVGQEVARLWQLCDEAAPGLRLRLDANGAWSADDASAFLSGIAGLPIDMVEEPLARPDLDTLAALQADVAFDLALDEGIGRVNRHRLLEHAPVRRLVLKPAVLGGLVPAVQLAAKARERGMASVITTTLESAAGTWAALHLAFAAGDPALCHGLATSGSFTEDSGRPPLPCRGSLRRPDTPGLGFLPGLREQ